MRTLLTALTILVATPILAAMVIVAALVRVPDRVGGIYDWAPRLWARLVVAAAGVRVVLHGTEHLQRQEPRVYALNHVSWFDIFTMASILSRYGFVAKAELFRIPLFGRASILTGAIPIQRENRKAAFAAYDQAAERIRGGRNVVVCPEGTRGKSYELRPFKRGPFVLAIAAQVPVVPVVLHGTREVQARGSFRVRAGTVHVHFHEPIPTAGSAYGDRDRLATTCWHAMDATLHGTYGVSSRPPSGRARGDEPGDAEGEAPEPAVASS